jgi:hypothetical protein
MATAVQPQKPADTATPPLSSKDLRIGDMFGHDRSESVASEPFSWKGLASCGASSSEDEVAGGQGEGIV